MRAAGVGGWWPRRYRPCRGRSDGHALVEPPSEGLGAVGVTVDGTLDRSSWRKLKFTFFTRVVIRPGRRRRCCSGKVRVRSARALEEVGGLQSGVLAGGRLGLRRAVYYRGVATTEPSSPSRFTVMPSAGSELLRSRAVPS